MASQLVRPPQLRLPSQSGDRHATWLKLFYDLVFAVAVSALGSRLGANVSPLLGALVVVIAAFVVFEMRYWDAWSKTTQSVSTKDEKQIT